MKQQVTCDFLGRMGNNMFQVAAMIGYAKKYNVSYGIPPIYRHKQLYNTWRNLPKFKGNSSRFKVHDEGQFGFEYHEIPFYPNGVKLRGFFQSEKYFLHCVDEVKKAFSLQIIPTDRVSIHVRRGDYVQYVDNFLPTTVEDVKKVVERFGNNRLGHNHFLICSDDISWCKQNLKGIDARFDFNEGTNEYQDLSAMASCAHHVVSRSSFSWWAAWLGHNPNKTVVTLTPWFGKNNNLNTIDIIPETWHKI